MVDAASTNPSPVAAALKPRYFWQRRRFWICSFVLFIVVVVAFVASLPTTQALVQFHRVGSGMTREEVLGLLGRPTNRMVYRSVFPGLGDEYHAWLIGELAFYVSYQDGKVIRKSMSTDVEIAHKFFPNLFNRDLL